MIYHTVHMLREKVKIVNAKGKGGIYYKNALNPQDPFFFKYKQTIIHFLIFGCAVSIASEHFQLWKAGVYSLWCEGFSLQWPSCCGASFR